jgi:hypothetical protein
MKIMNRTIPCFAVALLMLMAVGCNAPKETFDISVTNRLAEPVTVWLTKADGPYQEGWMPPEEIAAMSRATDHLQGAIVIQPGESQHAQTTGEVEKGNAAVLRVYRATTIDAILAISPASPNRLDVPLKPGINDFDIQMVQGRLIDTPHGAPATPSSP